MAIYSSGLWWAAAALLLAVPYTYCGEVRRGDVMYNRISQMIYLTRTLEDKLERHEQREKLLGEQIKKLLTNIDRHQIDIEGKVSRLDGRLANVETIILQMDEREKSIQRILVELKPSFKASTEFNNKMNDNLQRRFDATDAKLEAFSSEIKTLKNSVSPDSLRVLCPEVTDTSPFEKAISDSETLLNKYEQKLSEYNITAANATQAGSALLSEVAAADEAKHNKMSEDMERQEQKITKIQKLLSDAESMWKDLPRLADLNHATTQTLEAIANATGTIVLNDNTLDSGMQSKVSELGEKLEATNATIQQTLTQTVKDLLEGLATMNTQINNLPSTSTVLSISDNVLYIKKRLENSLTQLERIYSEVQTGNQRSDTLQHEIANNQSSLLDKHNVLLEGISSVVKFVYPLLTTNRDMLTNITSTSQNCSENSSTAVNKLENEVTEIMKELKDMEKLIKNEATTLRWKIESNSVPPIPVPGPRPSPASRRQVPRRN